MALPDDAIPSDATIRRMVSPSVTDAECQNLRESILLLRQLMETMPPPVDDLDPGHIFPLGPTA